MSRLAIVTLLALVPLSGAPAARAAEARPCVVTLESGGTRSRPDQPAESGCNPGDLLIIVRGGGGNGDLGAYAARWCARGGSMASVNVDAAQILVCRYAGPQGSRT